MDPLVPLPTSRRNLHAQGSGNRLKDALQAIVDQGLDWIDAVSHLPSDDRVRLARGAIAAVAICVLAFYYAY